MVKSKAACDSAYRASHRKEIAAYHAAYYARHREELAAYLAEYRAEHPEYNVWCSMIQRCTNPKHKFYKYYGGAGVKVCERWLTFENFLADLGKRPSPKHTLSRIADSGNYKKGNVVWGDRKHQEEQRKIKNQNQRVMDPFKMPMVPQGMLCQIQA